jgi:hypothetical protein
MGLKEILGESFDVFGRGIRPVSDKAQAMDGFGYHIAIENHIEAGHWTEKIADCFLAYCIPFYFGPPDITDYFPKEAIVPIDIFDIEGSARIIRREIKPGSYARRLPAIIEARKKVLSEYNLMHQIARLVRERHDPERPAISGELIYGRHRFRKKRPLAAFFDVAQRYRVNRRL